MKHIYIIVTVACLLGATSAKKIKGSKCSVKYFEQKYTCCGLEGKICPPTIEKLVQVVKLVPCTKMETSCVTPSVSSCTVETSYDCSKEECTNVTHSEPKTCTKVIQPECPKKEVCIDEVRDVPSTCFEKSEKEEAYMCPKKQNKTICRKVKVAVSGNDYSSKKHLKSNKHHYVDECNEVVVDVNGTCTRTVSFDKPVACTTQKTVQKCHMEQVECDSITHEYDCPIKTIQKECKLVEKTCQKKVDKECMKPVCTEKEVEKTCQEIVEELRTVKNPDARVCIIKIPDESKEICYK